METTKDIPAGSGSPPLPGSASRRIPLALYSCHHCAEDYSWPAEDLAWSNKLNEWVCENCWDDDVHGEPVIRLDAELKRQSKKLCNDDEQPAPSTRT